MFRRSSGLIIIPFWLGSMGWLFAHEIWPGLTAQDPPVVVASDFLSKEGNRIQRGVYDSFGRIGTIWSQYAVAEKTVRRDDLVWINVDRLAGGLGPVRLDIDSIYRPDGQLDEFTVKMELADREAKLHGERFHSDFSFTLESGPLFKTFKLPLSQAGMISEGFSPFNQLAGLKVGQRWRMQVFNPLSALSGFGESFTGVLVEVTGEETIATLEGPKRCLVVESSMVRAWVDEHGVVERQEVTLPFQGGRGALRIVREPYDDEARNAAMMVAERRGRRDR